MKTTSAILVGITAVLLSIFLRLEVFTLPIQGKGTWRESKTAWNIRYFVRHDANIFNPRQPYLNGEDNIVRYEFPMMQWSIAIVQKLCGEHILVMRLMVFLVSLLTLLAVYKIGLLFMEDSVLAAFGIWTFTFLPTFFFNSTSIMPDGLALCFGMFYMLYFFRHLKSGDTRDLMLAGMFISFAGLIKLPFILLGILSLIRAVQMMPKMQSPPSRDFFRYITVYAFALIPVLSWYIFVVPTWEENNIQAGFFKNFAGWPLFFDYFKHHYHQTFPKDILTTSTILLLGIGIFYLIKSRKLFFTQPVYFLVPFLLLVVYFFYILNVIEVSHDYYLMPFYPIFLLAILYGMYYLTRLKMAGKIMLGLLLVVMPVICWLRVKDNWDIRHAYFNPDFFICRQQLEQIGSRDDKAVFINDKSLAILPYIADKSGYIFWNDHLPIAWLRGMRTDLGAKYLFSDSRKIEAQEGFEDCVDGVILECGTLKVFKLKENQTSK